MRTPDAPAPFLEEAEQVLCHNAGLGHEDGRAPLGGAGKTQKRAETLSLRAATHTRDRFWRVSFSPDGLRLAAIAIEEIVLAIFRRI